MEAFGQDLWIIGSETGAPATLTLWKYRGICRVGDHQVGQWSTIVSVTVGA